MQGVAVLREQTRRFIADLPTEVTLSRSVASDDGAGGTVYGPPASLSPQTFKLTQQSESSATERRTSDGEVVRPTLRVVAEWDADIAIGDTFTWNGLPVEVVWITALPYEKLAEVAIR